MPYDDRNEPLDDEDWYYDEGDLEDDFEERESVHCPDCGAEVFRDADFCAKCGYWITDSDREKMGATAGGVKPWGKATALVVLGAFVLGSLGFLALLRERATRAASH